MKHKIRTTIIAAAVGTAALVGVASPANAATIQRQTFCDGAQTNQLGALVPVALGCENGTYDPETETYAPYDPAADTDGPLGIGLFGL